MQTLVAIKRISHVIPRELNSHPLLSACKTHLPKNKFYLINQFTQTLHSLRFPNSSLIFIKFTTRKQQENTINSIPYLFPDGNCINPLWTLNRQNKNSHLKYYWNLTQQPLEMEKEWSHCRRVVLLHKEYCDSVLLRFNTIHFLLLLCPRIKCVTRP